MITFSMVRIKRTSLWTKRTKRASERPNDCIKANRLRSNKPRRVLGDHPVSTVSFPPAILLAGATNPQRLPITCVCSPANTHFADRATTTTTHNNNHSRTYTRNIMFPVASAPFRKERKSHKHSPPYFSVLFLIP